MTLRAITKEEALMFAAQVWQHPTMGDRVMDGEMAQAIADTLYETNSGNANGMNICVQVQEDGEEKDVTLTLTFRRGRADACVDVVHRTIIPIDAEEADAYAEHTE